MSTGHVNQSTIIIRHRAACVSPIAADNVVMHVQDSEGRNEDFKYFVFRMEEEKLG